MRVIAFVQSTVFAAFTSVLATAYATPMPASSDGTEFPSLEAMLESESLDLQAQEGTSASSGGASAGSRPTSEFFVTLGQRTLDDDVAWDLIDEPFALGLEFSGRRAASPFGFEGGMLMAGDSTTIAGVDVDNFFLELFLGGRLTGDLGAQKRFHPYIGAGVGLVLADITGSSGGFSISDDDFSVGFYAHGGAYYRVGRSFSIGVDARILTGTDIELFGIPTDADYNQISLMFGWSM